MGSCQTSDVVEVSKTEKKSHNKAKLSEEEIQRMIEEQKSEFPDMKEWKGKRYTGIGIKKMKGYKCKLPIDELNKKRDEFWEVRDSSSTHNYKTWRIIHQACVYDELRANMLLEEYGLTTDEGCINHIVDKKGYHYIVPNYCVNDPYFEKEYKVEKDKKEKMLKLKLFEVGSNTNTEMEVSNLMKGEELKEEYRKKAKIDDNFNLRLFFSGNEIKDDHFLYQHDLQNGIKIVVMKLQKLEDKPKEKKKGKKKNKKKKDPEQMEEEKKNAVDNKEE